MTELNPTPRDELQSMIEGNAKGGEVFKFGNGLGFVPRNPDRAEAGGTAVIEKHHWAVGGVLPNYDDEEFALFIFPITSMLEK